MTTIPHHPPNSGPILKRPLSSADSGLNHLDARQRCGPFLNERVELVQVDRFYQVMLKTYLAAFADILFHSETGKSNSERRFRDELLYQIDSTPIGQTQVADEDVKLVFRAELEGGLKSECRLHVVTSPPKETRKGAVGVFMIFDQQNPHGLAFSKPRRQIQGDLRFHFFAGGKN
jgi:hypothetical protein